MLPQLHAERQIAAIEAVCVPEMTPASRQSLISRLGRRAAGPQRRAKSLHEALVGHARHVKEPREATK